jgi:hypothetical protein
MTFVVAFRFRGQREIHKGLASSLKIDGKGCLVLYDQYRSVTDHLALDDLRDLSIKSVRDRAARSAAV